jgi:hypothetical protein
LQEPFANQRIAFLTVLDYVCHNTIFDFRMKCLVVTEPTWVLWILLDSSTAYGFVEAKDAANCEVEIYKENTFLHQRPIKHN